MPNLFINFTKSKQKTFNMPIAHILLDGANYNFDLFFEHFQKRWGFPGIVPHRDKDSVGFIIDGVIVGCKFTPSPISAPALVQHARDCVIWPGAEKYVSLHNAHLTVALAREKNSIDSHILFSKVIDGLLNQKNALGVYIAPGLFESAYYIKHAEVLLSEKLPTDLWVHINCLGLEKDNGFSFYTSGMNKFEKKEFEMIETVQRDFIDAYYFIKKLINYAIENDIDFKSGDTVGSDDFKTVLTVSKGIHLKDASVKIMA